MASLTISQPSGAGSFSPGAGASGLWIGVAVLLSLSAGQEYQHELLDQTTGMGVTMANTTAQIASFTASGPGTVRFRSRARENYAWSPWIVRVARVNRTAAGVFVGAGIVPPALYEGTADGLGPRGYADQMDLVVQRANFAVVADEDGVAQVSTLVASRVTGQPQPPGPMTGLSALQVCGGFPALEDVGENCPDNIVVRQGIGGGALNGEASQMNFVGGDSRVPECPEIIFAEIGLHYLVDVDGTHIYDTVVPAGSPGPRVLSRTPKSFRIHAGENPTTGARVTLALQAVGPLTIESQEFTQISVGSLGHFAIAHVIASRPSLFVRHYALGVRHSAAVNVDLGDLVALAKLASFEATAIMKSSINNTFEHFRGVAKWFRTNAGGGLALIMSPRYDACYDSPTGRFVITDNGSTQGRVVVTPPPGETVETTIELVVKEQF